MNRREELVVKKTVIKKNESEKNESYTKVTHLRKTKMSMPEQKVLREIEVKNVKN